VLVKQKEKVGEKGEGFQFQIVNLKQYLIFDQQSVKNI
jgi:hypothetical protein